MTIAIRLALTALGATLKAPEWILLLPAGDITTRDGRVLRNVSPDTILASFASDQRDIPIDYEHATEVRAPEGLSAPAVGWINELKVEGGEIFGKVDWTAAGRQDVESRAYRYISPVVHLAPEERTVLRISSVALTNDPALYIKSLLNRREAPETQKDTAMLKAIAKALNLAETATEAEILSAIAVQHSEKEQLSAKVAKPDPAMFVLRTEHDTLITTCAQLRAEVKTLKDADTEKEVVALVDGAISAGKVIPAIRDSELELCRAIGATKYQERLSKLTATLTPGEDETRREPGKPTGKLDDAQKEMCRRLGVSEEDYLKNVDA